MPTIKPPRRRVRIISVESFKGGVGKTSIALYLAATACRSNRSQLTEVVFVDMDVLGESPFEMEIRDLGNGSATTLWQVLFPAWGRKPDAPCRVTVEVADSSIDLSVVTGEPPGMSFGYLGLTAAEREQLGEYRSEFRSISEFHSLFSHLISSQDNDHDLCVIIDMPPGAGSSYRALRREIKESQAVHPKFEWRSVIVVIPTFAEMDRILHYAPQPSGPAAASPLFVVNGVPDLVASDLGNRGVAISGEYTNALGFREFPVTSILENIVSDLATGTRRPSGPDIKDTDKYADTTSRKKAYSNFKDILADFPDPGDFPNTVWCLPSAAVYFRHSPETARAFSTSRRMVRFPNGFAVPCDDVPPNKGALSVAALQNLVTFDAT